MEGVQCCPYPLKVVNRTEFVVFLLRIHDPNIFDVDTFNLRDLLPSKEPYVLKEEDMTLEQQPIRSSVKLPRHEFVLAIIFAGDWSDVTLHHSMLVKCFACSGRSVFVFVSGIVHTTRHSKSGSPFSLVSQMSAYLCVSGSVKKR